MLHRLMSSCAPGTTLSALATMPGCGALTGLISCMHPGLEHLLQTALLQMGTKLLGTDVRIAARLVSKTLGGKRLSRQGPCSQHSMAWPHPQSACPSQVNMLTTAC